MVKVYDGGKPKALVAEFTSGETNMSVMQRLYDSEINVSVASLWDGGFDVKLGDDMNGFVAVGSFKQWDAAEAWLDKQARKHYPDSLYAKTP